MQTALRRQIRCSHGSSRRSQVGLTPVPLALPSPLGHYDAEAFRQQAFIPQKPLLFRKGAASPAFELPSLHKWFVCDAAGQRGVSGYLAAFEQQPFPYELLLSPELKHTTARFRNWLSEDPSAAGPGLAGNLEAALAEGEENSFVQLCAPLKLLIKALEFNRIHKAEAETAVQLYIAQSTLEDLPQQLKNDVPAPTLVQQAGKGDIYQSSVWLGTEPTYTSLHRDPNPNLFCQLCGSKSLRLLAPSHGQRLFCEVQAKIGRCGNSRIRTTDMMQGPEREALHDTVWHESNMKDMYEVQLGPGDALFIPTGWWHSVKSIEAQGQLNGSVNWWFR